MVMPTGSMASSRPLAGWRGIDPLPDTTRVEAAQLFRMGDRRVPERARRKWGESPLKVVGVMPRGFRVVTLEPEVLVPLWFDRSTLTLVFFQYQMAYAADA
jgi:hypothetical protein